jgi:ABC-type dipeptide/oligopeptide/nickel transport system ATPase subunit
MINGPIQSISLYYSNQEGCLRGVKGVFAEAGGPSLAGMVGNSGGSKETVLRLAAGEVVTKVEYKARG